MSITLDSIMTALRSVKDPDTGRDILSLGMVQDLRNDNDTVSLRLTVKSPARHVRESFEIQVRDALTRVGATQVKVLMDAPAAKARVAPDKAGIPGVKHIIAVSSGKGGVGKSTVSTNLAVALAAMGHKTGLLDTDVYGPNIPTMMGVGGQIPQAHMDEKRGELIIPLENHGVKIMSMGLLTKGDQPLVWRGPMLHSVVNQFLNQVDWGTLDYLVIDMPPGTGDVQLSLTQIAPVTGAVVVTTPQEVSLQDVRKAILMFEKVGVPVLGVVENMSYFTCDSCDKKHHIFGKGGGAALAERFHTMLLAELPLNPEVREGGDSGMPITLKNPSSVQAQAFFNLAKNIRDEVEQRSLDAGTHSGSPVVNIGAF